MSELTCLGVTIRKLKEGLYLHQQLYTEDLPPEHASHISARKRTTIGEPDHFQQETPLPPDPQNAERQEWIKRGRRIWGGILWLSTAVSSTTQALSKDLELPKVKPRHPLQHLNTTKTMGLLYPHPRRQELTECMQFTCPLEMFDT